MGLTLQVETDKMGRGFCRDFTDGPGGVVRQMGGEYTDTEFTLCKKMK